MRTRRIILSLLFSIFSFIGISNATNVNPQWTIVGSSYASAQWSSISPSINYRAQLNTAIGFGGGTMVVDTITVNTSWTFTNLNGNTSYYLRVKISSEVNGNYVAIATKTAPTTTLLNPIFSNVSTGSFSLNWTAVPGRSFIVALSSNSLFNPIFSSKTLSTNTTSYGTLNQNTSYYLKVKVSTETDLSYLINNVSTKTLSLPTTTQIIPTFTGVFGTSLTVNWTNISGSTYIAVLSSSNTFATILSSANIFTNTTSYTNLNSQSTYYFKVKITTESNLGYSSTISTITISTTPIIVISTTNLNPTVTSVSTNTINLTWSNVVGTSYIAVLSSAATIISSTTLSSNTTIYSNLSPSTTYSFKVKISTENDNGYFTVSTRTDNLVIPILPSTTSLTATYSNVQFTSATIAWTSITGVTYVIALSSNNFTNVLSSNSFTNNTTNYTNLLEGTTYYFKVKISSESDLGYSSVITTTTRITPVVIVTTTSLNPVLTNVQYSSFSVSWNSVTNSTYVIVLTSASVELSSFTLTTNITSFNGLNPSTTYTFKIKVSTESDFGYSLNSVSTRTLSLPISVLISSTILSPDFSAVYQSSLSVTWNQVTGSSYRAVLSSGGITVSSIVVTGGTTNFVNLDTNTTYQFKVKIDTETDNSYTLNTISTKTLAPFSPVVERSTTTLNPSFTAVNITSLTITWPLISGSSFNVVLSSGDLTILSSTTLTSNTTTFIGLNNDTTYSFKIKISTEQDTSYVVNTISTITKSIIIQPVVLSTTVLNPSFTVFTTSLTVNWTGAGTNYVIVLTSAGVTLSTAVCNTNTTSYTNLNPDTTYSFKLKVSTESDGAYGFNTISTKTLSLPVIVLISSTSLNPQFTSIQTSSLSISWLNMSSTYTVVLTSAGIVLSSASITAGNTTYIGLAGSTTYQFKIKLSSETDSAYLLNLVSTTTKIATFESGGESTTNIHPLITGVTTGSVSIGWDNVGSGFTIVISSKNDFSLILSSKSLSANSTTYTGLTEDTSYFLKVKISSESDNGYLSVSTKTNLIPVVITSTATTNLSAGSSSNIYITSFTFTWLNINSIYTIALSTSQTYVPTTSSGNVNANTSSYFNLEAGGTYYFKVKLSTENDSGYYSTTINMLQFPVTSTGTSVDTSTKTEVEDEPKISTETKKVEIDIIPGRTFTPNGDGINDSIFLDVHVKTDAVKESKIYDIHAAVVADFKKSVKNSDIITFEWDGKDQSGRDVPSGVYMYQVILNGSVLRGSIFIIH